MSFFIAEDPFILIYQDEVFFSNRECKSDRGMKKISHMPWCWRSKKRARNVVLFLKEGNFCNKQELWCGCLRKASLDGCEVILSQVQVISRVIRQLRDAGICNYKLFKHPYLTVCQVAEKNAPLLDDRLTGC